MIETALLFWILAHLSGVCAYILYLEDGGDATMEQLKKRAKRDNDDYVCRELWDSLEAKYMDEDASSKKFLVSNFTNYKMTDLRPVIEQYNELLGILRRFTQHKMNMDEAIQVSCITDKLPPSWKDFKHTLKHLKEDLTLVELGSHLRIEEPSGCKIVTIQRATMADPDKKANPTCWKCGKTGHIKRDCKGVNVGNKANGSGKKGSVDGSSNSLKGATVHVCKDRCWFNTNESLNDGSILHMGNESTALVHGRGCVDLRLNIINENIDSAFMSTSKVNDSILWHVRLSRIHFKRMQDMLKDGLIPSFDMDTEKFLELIRSDLCDLHATPLLGNKKYCVTFINYASWFCYVYLLHLKDEALDKFKVFKTKDELQQGSLIKRFRSDIGGEYMDTLYFQSVGIIHEMTASYTPQQNGISERKNRVLKEMVNFMLSYSGPNQRVWGYRAVIRLPDPKLKTLGKRGIKCIFGFVCFSEVLPLHLQPISAEEELHLKSSST
ncbi:zinc finger, CCHC-type containing protein [Tanacetum coccineum]